MTSLHGERATLKILNACGARLVHPLLALELIVLGAKLRTALVAMVVTTAVVVTVAMVAVAAMAAVTGDVVVNVRRHHRLPHRLQAPVGHEIALITVLTHTRLVLSLAR